MRRVIKKFESYLNHIRENFEDIFRNIWIMNDIFGGRKESEFAKQFWGKSKKKLWITRKKIPKKFKHISGKYEKNEKFVKYLK